MKNKKILIKMYVSKSTFSLGSIKPLKEALKNTDYQLKIIDITKNPEKAEKENIIATPTVIKELPPPIKKIIGELMDKDKILLGLDIVEKEDVKK